MGCFVLFCFPFSTLNISAYCLLASYVSDEKSARNFIKVLFFIIKLFIFIINLMRNFIKVLLSSCFQDPLHLGLAPSPAPPPPGQAQLGAHVHAGPVQCHGGGGGRRARRPGLFLPLQGRLQYPRPPSGQPAR